MEETKNNKKRPRDSEETQKSHKKKKLKESTFPTSSNDTFIKLSKSDRMDILWNNLIVSGHINISKCEKSGCKWMNFEEAVSKPECDHGQIDRKKICKDLEIDHNIDWFDDILQVREKQADGIARRLNCIFRLSSCCRWLIMVWNRKFNTLKWFSALLLRLDMEIVNLERVMKDRPSSNHLKAVLSSLSGDIKSKITDLSSDAMSMKSHVSKEDKISVCKLQIRSIALLDNLYWLLRHYAINTTQIASGKHQSTSSTELSSNDSHKISSKLSKKLAIPAPEAYFYSFYQDYQSVYDHAESVFMKKEIDGITRYALEDSIGGISLSIDTKSTNPLFFLWHLKRLEYIYFWYESGVAQDSSSLDTFLSSSNNTGSKLLSVVSSKNSKSLSNQKQRIHSHGVSNINENEPLCPDLLQTWRDAARDWPSLIYAYAVPSNKAIETLKKYSPILEVGAGTGYWLHVMKQNGVQVLGFDSLPPTTHGEQNEFHANVPPHHTVHPCNSTLVTRKYSDHTLFICFPPPNDNMALDYLTAFSGSTFIHIGEWDGFTGNKAFQSFLISNFELIELVQLPNWMDTCYDLTVWSRKAARKSTEIALTSKDSFNSNNHESTKKLTLPTRECWWCHSSTSVLRRCKFCRLACFCSKACCQAGSGRHNSIHHNQGIFLPMNQLDYGNSSKWRLLTND